MGIKSGEVKIISASGIDNMPGSFKNLEQTLVPLIAGKSPYSDRVVVLIDKPKTEDTKEVEEFKRSLKTNLFVLTEFSIEEYIPESIYQRAGRNKIDDLKEIEKNRNELTELRCLKKEISSGIARVLETSDLDTTPLIRDAVIRAFENQKKGSSGISVAHRVKSIKNVTVA